MQLNNLQSIILNDYAETLEKAIINKTIDKIATLVAENASISIYQQLLNQTASNTKSNKIISTCNNCQCHSEHNNAINKTEKLNQKHKININKVVKNNSVEKSFDTKNNFNEKSFDTKNNFNEKSFDTKNNFNEKSFDTKNNFNEKSFDTKNNSTEKSTSIKNNIDSVDTILNKLINILETNSKTNNKINEILSKDEVNKLLKAAFALNETDNNELFKAFFNCK